LLGLSESELFYGGVLMKRIGLIGGTGLLSFTEDKESILPWSLKNRNELTVETPYGDVPMTVLDLDNDGLECKIFFLQRHHNIHGGTNSPHNINHLANISAISSCRVDFTISVCSVGAVSETFKPGMVGLANQYIDFSGNSVSYNNIEAKFTSMTSPFNSDLNNKLLHSLRLSQPHLSELMDSDFLLTYWYSVGPQFETSAEILAISNFGADCVGMTLAPEAKLLAEKNIPFSAILIAGNHAAGLDPSDSNAILDHNNISSTATSRSEPVWFALKNIFT